MYIRIYFQKYNGFKRRKGLFYLEVLFLKKRLDFINSRISITF